MISKNDFFRFSIVFTTFITVILSSLLLWQYFHGGIPSHHFLADKTMPLISNAWGVLVIPIITWFLLLRVENGLFSPSDIISFPKHTWFGFLSSLVFGICLGLSITYGFKDFSSNALYIILGLALFFPTYKSEYLLGFVLGMTYFIGGVLPVVVGSVLLFISAVIYLGARRLILKLLKMVKTE